LSWLRVQRRIRVAALCSTPLVHGHMVCTRQAAIRCCFISLRTLFLGRHALGNPFEYILTLLVYNHVLRLNLVTRQWNLVDNYGDIPGVRMGMYYFSMSLCALLIGIHRTHCMLMAGQQAPSLRWRERAPPTSRRCHRIRPQDSTLDATRAPRPNTARPSPSFRSHLR
jgi:hypothetical protein